MKSGNGYMLGGGDQAYDGIDPADDLVIWSNVDKPTMQVMPEPEVKPFDWMDDAACTGVPVEVFDDPVLEQAKALCAKCPVRAQCYDLTKHSEYYYSAGMEAKERFVGKDYARVAA